MSNMNTLPLALLVSAQGRIATIRDKAERGSAMTEYGLIITLIVLVSIAAMTLFGDKVFALFSSSSDTYPESTN